MLTCTQPAMWWELSLPPDTDGCILIIASSKVINGARPAGEWIGFKKKEESPDFTARLPNYRCLAQFLNIPKLSHPLLSFLGNTLRQAHRRLQAMSLKVKGR